MRRRATITLHWLNLLLLLFVLGDGGATTWLSLLYAASALGMCALALVFGLMSGPGPKLEGAVRALHPWLHRAFTRSSAGALWRFWPKRSPRPCPAPARANCCLRCWRSPRCTRSSTSGGTPPLATGRCDGSRRAPFTTCSEGPMSDTPPPAPAVSEHRFPCASCGSDYRYDPGAGRLICDHCGDVAEIETGGPWQGGIRNLISAPPCATNSPRRRWKRPAPPNAQAAARRSNWATPPTPPNARSAPRPWSPIPALTARSSRARCCPSHWTNRRPARR